MCLELCICRSTSSLLCWDSTLPAVHKSQLPAGDFVETSREPLPAPLAGPCQVRWCMHDCVSTAVASACNNRQAGARWPDVHAMLLRLLCSHSHVRDTREAAPHLTCPF